MGEGSAHCSLGHSWGDGSGFYKKMRSASHGVNRRKLGEKGGSSAAPGT